MAGGGGERKLSYCSSMVVECVWERPGGEATEGGSDWPGYQNLSDAVSQYGDLRRITNFVY